MGIVAMVLDLKHFQNFHREAVNGVKMLLFWGFKAVSLSMLVIERKISYFFLKVQPKD